MGTKIKKKRRNGEIKESKHKKGRRRKRKGRWQTPRNPYEARHEIPSRKTQETSEASQELLGQQGEPNSSRLHRRRHGVPDCRNHGGRRRICQRGEEDQSQA